MADKEAVAVIQQKALTEGLGSLTPEEVKALKYAGVNDEKIINSDDYSEPQIRNIKERKDKGKKISNDEQAALIGKKIDKQENVITSIIHGYNDIFHKHYNFKEDNVSFDITIREPNISENGRILAQTNQYLYGMAEFATDYWYNIYHTISLIRICGEQVPVELQDDDSIYSPAYVWLEQIGHDFDEWESRFHS
jgi:hypothetical protein